MQNIIFNKITGESEKERSGIIESRGGAAAQSGESTAARSDLAPEQEELTIKERAERASEAEKLADKLSLRRRKSINQCFIAPEKTLANVIKAVEVDKELLQKQRKDRYFLYRCLPFINRRINFAQWVYRNSTAVTVTVACLLVAFIAFFSVRFVIAAPDFAQGFFVEMPADLPKPPPPELDQPKPEPEKPEPLPDQKIENLQNRASNANSKLDAGLKDNKNTQVADLYNEAAEVQRRLDAARSSNLRTAKAGESGIKAAPKVNTSTNASGENNKTAKVKGNVTVEYDVPAPTRTHTHLPIPAYQCEVGGKVVVNIQVNRNGDVVSASISRASSSRDNCICDRALESAKKTRFNINTDAPARQDGTITYLFLSQ